MADLSWLWELKRTTMRAYVAAAFGWEDADQYERFTAAFDPVKLRIIRVDRSDAGLIEVAEKECFFFIARIELLPIFQRRGIGSLVIAEVVDQAARRNKPVHLQVLRANPARRLYERLGFSVYEETATHFRLKTKMSAGPD